MTKQVASSQRDTIPRATLAETLGVASAVIGPMLAKGVIIRRPTIMRVSDQLDLSRRAVERMQVLRDKYGTGPLLLNIPGRSQALLLSPEHVSRVLEETPEPFATATAEKAASLAHFQPKGVLISHGSERTRRRHFNEEVLASDKPVHDLAGNFLRVVDDEAQRLFNATRHKAELTWNDFANVWFPVVRRVILGDSARDDETLTKQINRLRKNANWAFLHPRQDSLIKDFHEGIKSYLQKAEPGSLAQVIANTTASEEDIAPHHQISHWMFAFDPGGMTTFRTLALLASHPRQSEQALEEIHRQRGAEEQYLPFLRACVLESLRLWPTTPIILRETTEETRWETGTMPAHTSVAIFAPFFHRDESRLPEANRFAPELWQAAKPASNLPLVPFSAGPGVCPARHLVLLITSSMLAALVREHQFQIQPPTLIGPDKPLPGMLNHFTLRFTYQDQSQ
ncbi:MAG: cytochrome P450 [Halomonadaceae bacterium]|nr:MAG: cytochrome P450 [Halomonadaceae bacterium]